MPICNVTYSQDEPQICPDNTGGAVITWADYRTNAHFDIYAQRIDSAGQIQWDLNGDDICVAIEDQRYPLVLNAGEGNVLFLWGDRRTNPISGFEDLFIHRAFIPMAGIPGFEFELLLLAFSLSALVLVYAKKKSSILIK